MTTEVKSAYKVSITIKKFFYGLLFVLVPAGLLYTAQYLQDNSAEFPEEFVVYIPIIVGLITAIANYIKHRNDTVPV